MNRAAQKVQTSKGRTPEVSEAGPVQPHEYGEECGGSGGVPYSFFAQPPDRIRKVTVWHRQLVDGLQVETEKGPMPKIGGTGRHKDIRQESFALGADEFITGISVEFWTY